MSDRMPAGWYADPETPGMVRWWDGDAWADMRMPRDLAPQSASTGEKVAAVASGLAKLWFALLLLVICLAIIWAVFAG